MLTLLIGTDWVSCRNALLKRLANDVRMKKSGNVLIVPELISHDTERRLCMAAGNTASRYAEVLSFTRLSKAVTEEIKTANIDCMDAGGRIVAMAGAVRQIHSKLKAYASVETKPEFLNSLVEAIDEFKRCCISSSDLKAASLKTTGSFAQKLEELSLILESYDAICQHGKKDPRDQMTWLLEQLENCSYAQNHTFYIDGFPDFTRQHFAIINHLIRVSPNVIICINSDCVDSNELAFYKAGQTAGELLRAAETAEVETEIITVAPEACNLRFIRERIYQGKTESISEPLLTLSKSDSVYHECLAVAERVMKLVQEGARYRDVGITFTDPATYKNTLEMVFSRCHIPLYLSGTESVLEKTVIVTVLSALDTALGGFETEDVVRYMKSMLSPIPLDICDKVENYVKLWSISGLGWLDEWTANPSGLSDKWSEAAQKNIVILEKARKSIIEPLVTLRDSIRAAHNIAQQVEALYSFLEAIKLDAQLDALSKELDSEGDNRNAQILDQLWDILIGALEQLHDVLGTTSWDSDVFCRLFKLLLSQYDVGTIPPVLDAVIAGPVSTMRCQQVEHLLIVGATEGCLPGYTGSTGVFNDQERTALREMGVPLTGGALEGLQSEFAEIYGVFCSARSSVFVSYSGSQPSFVYRRLLRMTEKEEYYQPVLGTALGDAIEAGAFFARNNDAHSANLIGLSDQYEHIKMKIEHKIGSISFKNVQALYGEKLNLSASQVDKLADCRCHYFLRYGLRVDEQKPVAVDPAEFGTYVHAVLENTAREICELGGFSAVSEEETLAIARKHSSQYAKNRFGEINTIRARYLFDRNLVELEMIVKELWEELHSILFTPVGFEVSFGDGEQLPAIDCSGTNLKAQLRGFVDRVDRWNEGEKDYFRVVDYKTGRKDFDYCDVFNGLGLQMLLYLFALEQNSQKYFSAVSLPAGVQYFPARAPLLSVDGKMSDDELLLNRGKNWKRRGLLLQDGEVLNAMESSEIPGRLPYSIRKDGTYSGDLADGKQLKQLKLYIFALLKKLVDEIASGCISPNPYTRGASHDACAYCPYGKICHKNEVVDRRNYQAMSPQKFWDEVEKAVQKNG